MRPSRRVGRSAVVSRRSTPLPGSLLDAVVDRLDEQCVDADGHRTEMSWMEPDAVTECAPPRQETQASERAPELLRLMGDRSASVIRDLVRVTVLITSSPRPIWSSSGPTSDRWPRRADSPTRRRAAAAPSQPEPGADPNTDAVGATPTPPPQPQSASDADTTVADATHRPTPQDRQPHTSPARNAASAATPRPSPRPDAR